LVNSALPFACFALAALLLSAGLSAIFNATTPLWTAVIASLSLKVRLPPSRWLGLVIGLAGMRGLAAGKASLKTGEHGISPAVGIAACIAATLLCAFAANVAKQRLGGVPPMAVAAGSQLGAMFCLALPAWWFLAGHCPRRHGLGGGRCAGAGLHRRGLCRVLSPDRPRRPGHRHHRHAAGAELRAAVGRAGAGRGADPGHGRWLCGHPARRWAVDRLDPGAEALSHRGRRRGWSSVYGRNGGRPSDPGDLRCAEIGRRLGRPAPCRRACSEARSAGHGSRLRSRLRSTSQTEETPALEKEATRTTPT